MPWVRKLYEIGMLVVGFALPACAMVLVGLGPFVAPTSWPFAEIGASVAFWFTWFWVSAVIYFVMIIAWHLGVRRSRRRELAWFTDEGAKLKTMAAEVAQGEFERVQAGINAYYQKREAAFEAACDQAVHDIAARVVAEAKAHGVEIEAQAIVTHLPKKLNW